MKGGSGRVEDDDAWIESNRVPFRGEAPDEVDVFATGQALVEE